MNDTVHFEKTLSSETLFEGRVITLTKDTALLENGKTATREVVHHHGGACILPYFADGTICMVRQFRYAMQQQLWELPAGKLEKGEDPFEAAKRELGEECGLTADHYTPLGEFYPTVGYDTEIIYMWVATGLHTTQMHLDDDEFLTPDRIPLAKAYERNKGRQDHRGCAQAQGAGGRGQAVILYEDTALVVLDKPAGLSSEDGVPTALRKLWDRPDAYVGVIHRLDTGVSGLMVYAKTPQAAAALSRQVTQSQQVYAEQDGRAEPDSGTPDAPPFVKQYRALIAGGPDEKLPAEGVLRDYLFKDSRKGRVFPVSRPRKGVKEAVLEYRISASAPDGSTSLADITLHTGRTHQIRVQFASRRHPLWGDGKYGSRIKGDIALQSARLRFIHPDTGKVMDFRLPVPGTWPAWGIRQENDNGTTV